MTLRDVATPARVSIAYLSDLERGNLENPTLDKLRGIAAALGVSINDLLDVPEPGVAPKATKTPALSDFAGSEAFLTATEDQAKRMRRDVSDLRDDWLSLLGQIEVAGRRPRTGADFLFIFEAIRRAVEPS